MTDDAKITCNHTSFTSKDPSMTWNYRIVSVKDGYELREVYYTNGVATSMTEGAPSFWADTEEGPGIVTKALNTAHLDASKHPVFYPPADWD